MGTANTSLMPEFVQMDDTLFDTLMNKLSHPGPFSIRISYRCGSNFPLLSELMGTANTSTLA